MTRITPSALVATFTLMLACGGSTSDGSAPADGGGDAGPTIAQACADSAHARCSKIQSCSAIRVAQLYGDEASCEARVKTTCVANLSAPGNANNPAANEACAAADDGWACADFLANQNPPAACAQKLGPTATGGACSAFGQCQSGFCEYSTSGCGACQPAPTVRSAVLSHPPVRARPLVLREQDVRRGRGGRRGMRHVAAVRSRTHVHHVRLQGHRLDGRGWSAVRHRRRQDRRLHERHLRESRLRRVRGRRRVVRRHRGSLLHARRLLHRRHVSSARVSVKSLAPCALCAPCLAQ